MTPFEFWLQLRRIWRNGFSYEWNDGGNVDRVAFEDLLYNDLYGTLPDLPTCREYIHPLQSLLGWRGYSDIDRLSEDLWRVFHYPPKIDYVKTAEYENVLEDQFLAEHPGW